MLGRQEWPFELALWPGGQNGTRLYVQPDE